MKDCRKKEKWAINLRVGCKNYFIKNATCKNPLLRALAALDPSIRVHTHTLNELFKLPELEANVPVDQELDEFYMQVRKYIIVNNLPQKTCRIDEWWGKMDDKDEFIVLKNGLCPFILFS